MNHFGHLKFAMRTDVGRMRSNNEDACDAFWKYGVFCVSDGMGGGDDGEIASEKTISAVSRFCAENELPEESTYRIGDIVAGLCAALNEASALIYSRAVELNLHGCGATFVGVCFDAANPAEAVALHAGDSRLYRIRRRGIEQITKDHSAAALLGAKDDRELNPMFRGVILRAVGVSPSVEIDKTHFLVKAGDRILICSDGLSRMVSDRKISSIVRKSENVQVAVDRLIEAANDAGGVDNITAVVVEIGTLPQPLTAMPMHALSPKGEEHGLGDDASTDTAEILDADTAEDTAEIVANSDCKAEYGVGLSAQPSVKGESDTEEIQEAPNSRWGKKRVAKIVGLAGILLVVAAPFVISIVGGQNKAEEVRHESVTATNAITCSKQENPFGDLVASLSRRIEEIDPIESRQERIDELKREIAVAVTSNALLHASAQHLMEALSERKRWIVGKIENNSSGDVLVAGKLVSTNSTETYIFKDGKVPSRWVASREWHEDRPLDHDFDGRTIRLSDQDFKLKKVRVFVERGKIGPNVTCWIEGQHVVNDEIWATPGQVLECVYKKDAKRRTYLDQTVKYRVEFRSEQCLPLPRNWEYSRTRRILPPDLPEGATCWVGSEEFKMELVRKAEETVTYVCRREGYESITNTYLVGLDGIQKISLPPETNWRPLLVRVEIPDVPGEVSARIDGERVPGVFRMLGPGNHTLQYERIDYKSQKVVKFKVEAGMTMQLPKPTSSWIASDALSKLQEAEKAAEAGEWARAQDVLRGVKVMSTVNEKRRMALTVRIRDEMSRAAAKKDFEEAVDGLLKVCSRDVVAGITNSVSTVQLLKDGDKEFARQLAKCARAREDGNLFDAVRGFLSVSQKIAESSHSYVLQLEYDAQSMHGRTRVGGTQNVGTETPLTPEMKMAGAVKERAEEFIAALNECDFDRRDMKKMAGAVRSCAAFLKSFHDAAFH